MQQKRQCGISPSDIDIRFDSSVGGYWFEFRNSNGRSVLDSRTASTGARGVYPSSEDAAVCAMDYAFRNRIAYDAKDNMDSIHSGLVSKYKSMLDYCHQKLRDIGYDAENDSYDNKTRTVPALKKFIETIVGNGQGAGEIDNIISTVKKDSNEDKNDRDVKTLMEYRNAFVEMLEYISRNSDKWLSTKNASVVFGMIKTASGDQMDFLPELASFYVDKACGAIGMVEPKILGMCDSPDGYDVHVVSGNRKAVVHIGDDAMFRGVVESCGPAPYTYSYYTDVMIPCLLSIGHIRPMDNDDVVILAAKLMSSGPDRYDAISRKDKKRKVVSFSPVMGKGTKGCSYKCSVEEPLAKAASAQQDLNDALKNNAERIMAAKMVTVTKPGSEYEGMAGEVDGSRLEFYNSHIEFPVKIKMDTGLVTEVWMTDGDVEIYA